MPIEGAGMSIERNVELIRRLYETAVSGHDADAAAAHYAEDAVNHGVRVGRAGMRCVFAGLFAAFPDVRYEILDPIAADDRVSCRAVMTGTHLGEPAKPEMFQGMLAGVEPTGRRVRVLQYHEFRVGGGLIVEHEAVRDDLGLLLQLGLLRPGPGQDSEARRSTRS